MKTINIGTNEFTEILIDDKPGDGNIYHKYYISRVNRLRFDLISDFGSIKFQKGPVKEAGINGCHQEDLLAIVIHRLRGFQSSEFACRENALALTKIEEALHWLNHRTTERTKRGVEGTNTI